MKSVLLLDNTSHSLGLYPLKSQGYSVVTADTVAHARQIIDDEEPELVIAMISPHSRELLEMAEVAQKRGIRIFWMGNSTQPQQHSWPASEISCPAISRILDLRLHCGPSD